MLENIIFGISDKFLERNIVEILWWQNHTCDMSWVFFYCISWVQVDEVALSIKKHSSSIEFSQILVVCLITWFDIMKIWRKWVTESVSQLIK